MRLFVHHFWVHTEPHFRKLSRFLCFPSFYSRRRLKSVSYCYCFTLLFFVWS